MRKAIVPAIVLFLVATSFCVRALGRFEHKDIEGDKKALLIAQRPRDAKADLDQEIPEVKEKDSPLWWVFGGYAEGTGANIFIDWKSLEKAGIPRETNISLDVGAVKLSKALAITLAEAEKTSKKSVRLGFTTSLEVIYISTTEGLKSLDAMRQRHDAEKLADQDQKVLEERFLQPCIYDDVGGVPWGFGSDEMSLEMALNDVAERRHMTLHVDWTSLHKAGIEPETAFALELNNVTAAEALQAILGSVAPPGTLDYKIDHGDLTIFLVEKPAERK